MCMVVSPGGAKQPYTSCENAPRSAQHRIQRLDEEVLAPHDALVDAEALALVVAAVLEDAFPAGRLDRQELGRAERGHDGVGVAPVARGVGGLTRDLGELEQPTRSDRC